MTVTVNREHGASRGNLTGVTQPSRPETIGELLASIRGATFPKLSQKAAAERAREISGSKMSGDYWSNVERDAVIGRKGNKVTVTAETLAPMFAVLPMTADDHADLRRIRPDVADRLDHLMKLAAEQPPPVQAAPHLTDPATEEAISRFYEKAIPAVGREYGEHHERVLLDYWHLTDADGRLLPLRDRAAMIDRWIAKYLTGTESNGENKTSDVI